MSAVIDLWTLRFQSYGGSVQFYKMKMVGLA